jgi:putative YhdH/YhfP family quinone oxidoreductase
MAEIAGKFRAMVVTENGDGTFARRVVVRNFDELPPGEVLVRVHWSSLNYKDALSASGNRGVTKAYPHTPGVDAAGVVVESAHPEFSSGDEVLVTSYDLGMNTSGGFAEYIRVPAAWVVPLPAGLNLKESMMLGTAGLTAGLAVRALGGIAAQNRGEILVTGASGGVGILAVSILARLGCRVAAVSGKPQAADLLRFLGATSLLSREEASEGKDKPLLKGRWAGVIDGVGGDILATAIKSLLPQGVAACCGNVASVDLPLTVFPFILRGVSLIGIDSQNCPMRERREVWQLLAGEWKPQHLHQICREVALEELDKEIGVILSGGQQGRVVVRM